jgi:hypothetical protein
VFSYSDTPLLIPSRADGDKTNILTHHRYFYQTMDNIQGKYSHDVKEIIDYVFITVFTLQIDLCNCRTILDGAGVQIFPSSRDGNSRSVVGMTFIPSFIKIG